MRTIENRRIGDDVRDAAAQTVAGVTAVPVPRPFLRGRGAVPAQARPDYPPALFDWIASIAPARIDAGAGCGSGQATAASRGCSRVRHRPETRRRSATPRAGERGFRGPAGRACSLADASADAACVAQATLVRAAALLRRMRTRAAPRRRARGLGLQHRTRRRHRRRITPRCRRDPRRLAAGTAFIDEGYASFDFPFRTHRRARVRIARGMDPAAPARLFLPAIRRAKRHRATVANRVALRRRWPRR